MFRTVPICSQDTEAYLEKLGSKLAGVKVGQEAQEAAEVAAAEARAAGFSEEEVRMVAQSAAREAKANSRVVKQVRTSSWILGTVSQRG